ncbi:GNAT family N-acetyltransferase [Nocardioides iriomotensis]|uniref:GNAT family N-acetyltransferase n=1 Tax=Nocardioides iriomotensis TaxID=715784 RepID=A0A4Q5IX01_9ACTN|nr:GNAT family N-acetyltransferase [Nocardioides iriomotensis]RYU09399.1 GNAT family N-acetyltransferase [Nocardioides iriomotensis]
MSEVWVRLAGPDDWATWRDLRLRALQDSPSAFGSTYAREAAFDETAWRDRLSPTEPTDVAVLAYHEAVPVGMGGGFGDLPGFVHVVAMWTDPAHRGHGVGAAVLGALAAWADERGFRLHLDVNTVNDGARALYERSGYIATGETRPLREGSDERVERMVLAG